MYVFSESFYSLGDQILRFETRLGRLHSRKKINGSKDPLNLAILTAKFKAAGWIL